MNRQNPMCAVLMMLFATFLARPVLANAILPTDKNLEALGNAALATNVMIVNAFGASVGNILNFSGSYSDVGWSLNISGTYMGMPLSLSYAGTFDLATNAGLVISTGSLDGNPWTGHSTYSFTDTGPNSTTMRFDTFASFGPTPDFFWDEHTATTNVRSGSNIEDIIELVVTFRDVEVARYPLGNSVEPADPNEGLASFRTIDTFVSGTVGPSGTITGTLTTIPEPRPFALFVTGALSVLSYGWRRRDGIRLRIQKGPTEPSVHQLRENWSVQHQRDESGTPD